MRKLLLIQPPLLAESNSGLYNLAALATYVEKECEVRILDTSQDSLENTLKEFSPDIVGITSYSITYQDATATMKTVRRLAPEALRIIGGVHISCIPESLDEVFDAGVVGDGEETLLDIIRKGSRKNLFDIPGVCCHKAGQVKVNPRPQLDTARLPVPLLHKYAPNSCKNRIVAFITSRGCPYKCVYCYNPALRQKVRNYPVEWVADQFDYAINNLNANYLMLLDDSVSSDVPKLNALAEELKRRNLIKFRAAVNIRSSSVNEDLCRALKELNVVSWNCGFESGSDRILKQIKGASASVAKNKYIVRLAHKYDVTLNGSFMFGIPGETTDDMEQTLRFMKFLYEEKQAHRYRGGFWSFCATPFPGTSWWRIAKRKGKVHNHMDWTKLDIKNFDFHLMLDDTVSLNQWVDIHKRALDIAEKNNHSSFSE